MDALTTLTHPAAIDRAEEVDLADRAVGNTLVQFANPTLRMLFGVILVAVLTRYLGPHGFGEYALVLAFVATFTGVFSDWGLATICLREIARHPEERGQLIRSAATLQTLIAVLSYTIMLASLLLLRYPTVVVEGVALYGVTILLGPLDILALPFGADLRLSKLVAPALAGVVLSFVLTLSVVFLHGNLLALLGAALTGILLQYAWTTRLSLRLLKVPFRPATGHWRALLKEAWPLSAGTVVGAALQQGPLLALSLVSVGAVGLFNAANRIPQQLLVLPLAVRATMFPVLSRSWVEDRPRFARQLAALIDASLLAGIPIAIIGVPLAAPLVHLFFGPAFAGAAVPFALALVTFGLMFPGILIGEALIAAGFQRINLLILSASLPILVVLLLVLVPTGGASGAALAVLVSYAAIVAANAVVARWHLKSAIPISALPRAAAGVVAGVGTLAATPSLGRVASSVLAGLAALTVLGVLQPRTVGDIWSRLSSGRFARGGPGQGQQTPRDHEPTWMPRVVDELRHLAVWEIDASGARYRLYGPQTIAVHTQIDRDLERMQEFVRLFPADSAALRVLDLGANPYILSYALARSGSAVVATAAPTHDSARSRFGSVEFEQPGEGIRLTIPLARFNAESDPFPFPDRSFSVVVCGELIEHLANGPDRLLFECNRVLAPGGRLLISTPNAVSLARMISIARGVNPDWPFSPQGIYARHNRLYTFPELRDLLAGNGFQPLLEKGLTFRHERAWYAPGPLGFAKWVAMTAVNELLAWQPFRLRRLAEGGLVMGAKMAGPTLYRPGWLFGSADSLPMFGTGSASNLDVVAGARP